MTAQADLESRLQEAERKLIESEKNHTYWYRRACIAEAALQPFSDRFEEVAAARNEGRLAPKTPGMVVEARYETAHRVLAEMRKTGKPEIENLEDYVRQERQRKMHRWALRSFGLDRMGIYDRAVRLYEESVELFFAWIYDAVAEDLQIDHGPEAHAKWVEVAQNARDHAIRVLDAKMVEPPGKVEQEIGGVALTLNIGAQVSGHAVALCERQEFERVLSKPQTHWTAREAFKQDQGL